MPRKLLLAVALAALVPAMTTPAFASTGHHHHQAKPTVILVHGAFADASSWTKVVARLQTAGYPVIAPANPLRDLKGDSDYVSSVISTVPGPVILVGHSYGGSVISAAATGHANVKALVYVAGYAPEAGESALDLTAKFPGSALPTSLLTRDYPGGTDVYVDPAKFRAAVAADLPARDTALAAATQRPVSYAALDAKATTAAWQKIPSWYLVSGADQAIPAAAQKFMAKRAGAHTTEIKGASHLVMVSHPEAAADLVAAADRATR
ncbi:alpha/beta fold hydrolase [Herbidospora cretacea]|uniref:alpha/beta fold hydrolase n=1 Tax=Herbidospora cretacea TaxID=28444 RepID=UPI0004C3E2D9|nr:alpha/beta hydrolase [Herbidospora cretacea]